MKKKLWQAAFVGSALTLLMLFMIPALMGVEALFPPYRRPDGLYTQTDRTIPLTIVLVTSAWVANWITSLVFKAARISDGSWSLFRKRWT